ncbi:MAG: amidohydrolase family protein [Pirellulaceae bacterium]
MQNRIFNSLVVLCVLAVAVFSRFANAQDEQRIIRILNVNIVDVVDGSIKPNQDVLIKEGKITAVETSAELNPNSGETTIDGTNRFLIPGLWDMHVHWYDYKRCALFPLNGVTGIRVMSGIPFHRTWSSQFDSNKSIGPEMVIASPIIDGPNPIWPGSMEAASADDAVRIFQQCLKLKPDFLKVYSLLPRDAYFKLAELARAEGIPFSGHVPYTVSILEASDAGHAAMEHLYEFAIACSSEEEELRKMQREAMPDPQNPRTYFDDKEVLGTVMRRAIASFDEAKAQDVFAKLAKNKTWQCPTLTVIRNMAYLNTETVQSNPDVKYFAESVRKSLAPTPEQFNRNDDFYKHNQRIFEFNRRLIKPLHDAGVPLLAGTDCLNPFCLPGFSLHDELELLVEAGLSPTESLRTATINPAIFLGKTDSHGSIEPGKVADLVLLDANPLENIGSTRKIHAVVLNGRLITNEQRIAELKKYDTTAITD